MSVTAVVDNKNKDEENIIFLSNSVNLSFEYGLNRNIKNRMTKYFSAVRGGNTSWFSTYLDPKPFVLKNKGQKLYVFKKLSREEKNRAIEELKKIIIDRLIYAYFLRNY